MEFEHVTFDLPHGTFHALQGGDPDGQPTLVLHGFPDHPPTATPFLAELGRRGRHVVAPWLRGYAPSPTAGPFDLAALTSDVLALIDRWSPGRAVELVGHDWGAAITYGACVTAPEQIERAVTLAFPHPLTFLSRPRSAQLRRSWSKRQPDDTDQHHPDQAETEPRSDDAADHEVADVHETTDPGQDSEGNTGKTLQDCSATPCPGPRPEPQPSMIRRCPLAPGTMSREKGIPARPVNSPEPGTARTSNEQRIRISKVPQTGVHGTLPFSLDRKQKPRCFPPCGCSHCRTAPLSSTLALWRG